MRPATPQLSLAGCRQRPDSVTQRQCHGEQCGHRGTVTRPGPVTAGCHESRARCQSRSDSRPRARRVCQPHRHQKHTRPSGPGPPSTQSPPASPERRVKLRPGSVFEHRQVYPPERRPPPRLRRETQCLFFPHKLPARNVCSGACLIKGQNSSCANSFQVQGAARDRRCACNLRWTEINRDWVNFCPT
jgi:hypothetical protein